MQTKRAAQLTATVGFTSSAVERAALPRAPQRPAVTVPVLLLQTLLLVERHVRFYLKISGRWIVKILAAIVFTLTVRLYRSLGRIPRVALSSSIQNVCQCLKPFNRLCLKMQPSPSKPLALSAPD